MKYFFLPFLVAVLSLTGFSQKSNDNSFYKSRPKTYTAVNDYAGMFTKTERAALTKKLLQYRDSSTNEIVIITQQTLKDPINKAAYPLEEAAKHYFNNWGIGLKEKNNGVLIFIVKGDRKIRIATGLGIENILTNDDCKRIIDEHIVPQFKKSNYYHGLDTAIQKIMEVLSPGLYGIKNEVAFVIDAPQPGSQSFSYIPDPPKDNAFIPFIFLALIIFAIVLFIVKRSRGNNAAETVYDSSGSSRPSFSSGYGLLWFFSGLFGSSLINNRNTSNSGNYRSGNNSNIDNSFSSSDSYSSPSSDSFSSSFDSGSSFDGGSTDSGGASGSW
jgi:uncharacterized membrane protein YgcG